MSLLRSLVSGLLLVLAFLPVAVCGADQPLPDYLQDRGSGIPTSLFGTYIESGQWILYPFYEYSRNTDEEYDPRELGFPRPGFAETPRYDPRSSVFRVLFAGEDLTGTRGGALSRICIQ